MIEIGRYNTLKAIRRTPQGFYLGNEEEEVLLPNKYIPRYLEPEQELEVFVYLDSEERIVTTTLKPKIHLYEFAVLEVKDVNKSGAFLDWGLEKDLMVPFSEQKKNMKVGEKYLVFLYLDADSNRLAASSKIDKFLETEKITVKEGDQVDLLIGDSTDIGVNVIINNIHRGLIYHNEIFRNLTPGEKTIGFIKEVRSDNKIDVSLQKQGYQNVDPSAISIINKLETAGGFLPFNDNSTPESIMETFQMSKKTFKKSIGLLYKQKQIIIEESGIRLV